MASSIPALTALSLSLAGGRCPATLSVCLSIVAALSRHLSGWTTFPWAQVPNKERETTAEVRGGFLQPGGKD